jgi:hypothetical protein
VGRFYFGFTFAGEAWRDRREPELLKTVLDGKMTPHAAMKESIRLAPTDPSNLHDGSLVPAECLRANATQ